MRNGRRWFGMWSVVAWWVVVTAALSLLSMGLGHGPNVPGCAASAAFFVALGEAGHWLRSRYARRALRGREAG
ncbi:hypothetical protein [Streptomyces sp. NPDC095613]|uniref:hypothetical protein n=1 Tax=Streptomyces sp. NPDC095613 TaxID=3155540 RepID=UPI00331C10E8